MKPSRPRVRFTDPIFRLALAAAVAAILGLAPPLCAATPAAGTVSEGSPTVAWTGPFLVPTASPECAGPNDPACDNFQLTIVPPSFSFLVEVKVTPVQTDWDLEVYNPGGAFAKRSGNAPGVAETILLINPAGGTWTVSAAPFAPAPTTPSYTATATIKPYTAPPPGTEEISYVTYPAPGGLGSQAGEPSVGVNHETNNAMYIAFFEQLRIAFDDCSSIPTDTWTDVSFATTSVVTADPILFTDNVTGRTFASQLVAAGSLMAFTDDDGGSWLPSHGSGIASGVDHQTVGGGMFHEPLTRDPAGPLYPHAVYYCSQDLADALCARSDDGGLTFGPAVPIYTILDCGGLHGSVKVAPDDGTVYVPNKSCGHQAVVVSEDNGITWEVRRVPGTASSEFDPSAAIAEDGTVYLGMRDGGHPLVAVSRDRGLSWTVPQDVGTEFGIENIAFPVMVAGDPDRAAMAFLGTTEEGFATGSDASWPGVWHLYASHTYDGGVTWTTLNVTPDDPAQRGMICSEGIDCTGARNLLDFNDADVDRFGRVIVGWADGCVGSCISVPPNSGEDLAVVSRQTTGRRMFAEFDTIDVPAAPPAKAVIFDDDPTTVHLSWLEPDEGGSPITAYHVERRTASGSFTRIATLGAGARGYDDPIDPAESYFYRVLAENDFGESPACGELAPVVVPNACAFPGLVAVANPPEAGCTLDLTWGAIPAICPGAASIRYNIYRDVDPGFTPSPANAIALGASGLSYRDQDDLESGVAYHYIVRAENLATPGAGPNGGVEEANLVRRSAAPQGVLGPGPAFVDDLEPAALPGYATSSTRDAGGWQVVADLTAHSVTNAWVVLDDQPGSPILTQKDDRLVLPPLNLTASSVMSFYHNFDLARFPDQPLPPPEFHSGGVLEISMNGSTWIDLGPYITTGGYNGTVQSGAQSPLMDRMAWVGSSDGTAGTNVPGRNDPMQLVEVDLGQAIQTEFGATSLPGARVRFRLGGTFQVLIGGVQGSGWGVDDVQVTNLLAPDACETLSPEPAGRVDLLSLGRGTGDDITLSWGNSCAVGDDDYAIYEGTLGSYYSHGAKYCSTNGATTLSFAPPGGSSYYLVVPTNGLREGSYGARSSGLERPQGDDACLTRKVAVPCP